jgi:membrane-associated phospholipid phosphatase
MKNEKCKMRKRRLVSAFCIMHFLFAGRPAVGVEPKPAWETRAQQVARARLDTYVQRQTWRASEAARAEPAKWQSRTTGGGQTGWEPDTGGWKPRTEGMVPSPQPSAPDPQPPVPGVFELSRFSLAALANENTPAETEREIAPADPAAPGLVPAEPQPIPVERGPLPGFRETVLRDLTEMPGDLWHDTKKVYGNLGNMLFLVGAGGASIAIRTSGADDSLEDHYRRKNTMSQGWRDTFDVVGSPGLHFALAGVWYLAGQQLQDDKTYEVARAMGSVLIINGVSTLGLKLAASTRGPNRHRFAWPSGHTSSSFAMATVLHNAYGPWVGIPSYGVSTLVALQRMDAREHHLSDVVFGAALGWVVAETVMKDRQPLIFGGQIVPYVDPENGGAGVAWVKPLGE